MIVAVKLKETTNTDTVAAMLVISIHAAIGRSWLIEYAEKMWEIESIEIESLIISTRSDEDPLARGTVVTAIHRPHINYADLNVLDKMRVLELDRHGYHERPYAIHCSVLVSSDTI